MICRDKLGHTEPLRGLPEIDIKKNVFFKFFEAEQTGTGLTQ